MEKRRLISLRSVLLQYLVRTALACLLVAVGWLLVVLLWIQNSGLFLPANQAAQAKNQSSHHCSHIYGTISTFQILDCHRHCLIFSLIQYK